ncbi:MAG: hypothetical protein B7X39_13020 [Lysobacterales bacterium 14-68-21]|jgi:hypothetical protein|nr:MAG: hypothetical protein B7X45_11910 [Xanthomonadales bacterium 15-68-25]OZB65197.1 MAG: hypothetical protein B7X39_13020 [Xanthomonadales bacterium 14-68-21]
MKKHKQRAATTFTTDASGRRIAHVALSGTTERTKLLADDLDRILADGYSPLWSFTITGGDRWYVLVPANNPKGRQRTLTVARLVAQAGRGQIVKYADGDRLNLLPENLLVKEGTAWTPIDRVTPRAVSQERNEGDAQAPMDVLDKPAQRGEHCGHRARAPRPTHRVRSSRQPGGETEAADPDVPPQISVTVSK